MEAELIGKCLKYKDTEKELFICIVGKNRVAEGTKGEAANAVYLDPNKNVAGYKTIYPFNNGFLSKCEPVTDPMLKKMFEFALPDKSFLETN